MATLVKQTNSNVLMADVLIWNGVVITSQTVFMSDERNCSIGKVCCTIVSLVTFMFTRPLHLGEVVMDRKRQFKQYFSYIIALNGGNHNASRRKS